MATLRVCYFPSYTTTLSCRECKLSPTHLLQPSFTISLPLSQFHVRASQTNTTTRTRTRRSRRLKSDAEICNDIRQFLASVGLPEDHIPSTKELLLHGWNDLANIVRRRGHKQIQELLATNLLNVCEDSLTGQNEKVESLVHDVTASTEFVLGNSSSSLYADSSLSLDECASVAANSSVEDGLGEVKDHTEVVNNESEGSFYPSPTRATISDNGSNSLREGLYPNFDSRSSMPTEISGESPYETLSSDLDTGDEELSRLEPLDGLDDSNENIAEAVPMTSEVSVRENLAGDNRNDSIVHSADSHDTLSNLSLKEKIANFIQNGDLDPVEDHVYGISNGDDSQESKEYTESESAVDIPLGAHPPKDNNVMALHGSSLASKQVAPSGALDQPFGDDHMPHEDVSVTTHFDKDMDTKAPKVQNEREINHLKFMLYQKELELSRLKEQIEKEKLALSVLQTKAEAEISKARKLISEKDAQLLDAEESLSGLKEIQIEFCGDGDVVEVAGSFNGWHNRIKMDPQPSTSAIDLLGSRKSRFWSTMLWLYPGVYEIKFVVDGQWRTDPQRETVTRGHICNNILRVDR